jgi:hypothetical protein
LQDGSSHVRFLWKDRDGRSEPVVSEVPPTDVSFIIVLTLTEKGLFPVVVTVPDGLSDAFAQSFGYFVTTPLLDEGSHVSLEIEGLEARCALVEVPRDLGPPFGGELSVQVVVEPVHGLRAVVTGTAVPRSRTERSGRCRVRPVGVAHEAIHPLN